MTEPYPQYPQQPGQPPYGQPPGPPPENNLVWAILCTVLCCLPLGIVAIIKANEVNTLWYQGQFDRARASAEAAKKWSMWGAITAVAVFAIFAIVYVIIIVVAVNSIPELN